MLPQHSKIPPQRQLLHLTRLLLRQNAHLKPMLLPKLHHRAIRNPRPRPLHPRLLVRAPQRTQTNSMANSIVIHIQTRRKRRKLSLILTRNPRFEVSVPRISLQVLVEVLQAGQDVEVLVAGGGGECLGEQRGAGKTFRRRRAF